MERNEIVDWHGDNGPYGREIFARCPDFGPGALKIPGEIVEESFRAVEEEFGAALRAQVSIARDAWDRMQHTSTA